MKHLHCNVVCSNVSPFSKLNTGNESELLCLLYSDWCGAFSFFTFTGFDVFVASFPFFLFFFFFWPFQHTPLTHTVAIPVTHFNLHSLMWRFKAWSLLCAVIRQSEQLNCKGAWMHWKSGTRIDCPSLHFFSCEFVFDWNIKTWPVARDGYIHDNLGRSVKKMW